MRNEGRSDIINSRVNDSGRHISSTYHSAVDEGSADVIKKVIASIEYTSSLVVENETATPDLISFQYWNKTND